MPAMQRIDHISPLWAKDSVLERTSCLLPPLRKKTYFSCGDRRGVPFVGTWATGTPFAWKIFTFIYCMINIGVLTGVI